MLIIHRAPTLLTSLLAPALFWVLFTHSASSQANYKVPRWHFVETPLADEMPIQPQKNRIYTRVIGQNFTGTLIALDGNGNSLKPVSGSTTKLAIVRSYVPGFDTDNQNDESKTKACSNLPVFIDAGTRGDATNSIVSVLLPLTSGPTRVARFRATGTDTLKGPYCSVDTFTIRADKFVLSAAPSLLADPSGLNANTPSPQQAGSYFDIQASVTGFFGNKGSLPNYDESGFWRPRLILRQNSQAHTEWPAIDEGVNEGKYRAGQLSTVNANLVDGDLEYQNFKHSSINSGAKTHTYKISVRYDEVGYFRLKANSVIDEEYVKGSSDFANGDCIVNSASNVADKTGRVGCNIGSEPSFYFGRFIPASLQLEARPGCASTDPSKAFTYSGQPFALTLSALNKQKMVTQNYRGAFAKNVTLSLSSAAAGLGGLSTPTSPTPLGATLTIPAKAFVAGVATVPIIYTFNNAQTAPTTIQLTAKDEDGVTQLAAVNLQVRSGRAVLGSALGVTNLPLRVPFSTEQWAGNGVWVSNTDDTCTGNEALAIASVATEDGVSTPVSADDRARVAVSLVLQPNTLTCVLEDAVAAPGQSGAACEAVTSAAPGQLYIDGGSLSFAGDFNLWLSAPNQTGSVTVTGRVPVWLGTPEAKATFGIKSSPTILRQEVIHNIGAY